MSASKVVWATLLVAACACLAGSAGLAGGISLAGCAGVGAPAAPGTTVVASEPGTAYSSTTATSYPVTTAAPVSASPTSALTASSTTGPTAEPTTTTGALVTNTTAGEDGMADVVKVIDGDTVRVRILGGDIPGTAPGAQEDIRLIGIDAPETGEDFAAQATAALKGLLSHAGGEITLYVDEETRDQYGRVLAYVFCGDQMEVFANAEMLRQGLATLYVVPPNVERVSTLEAAQEEAQTAGAGIWASAKASPLKIVRVEYDPPGDDTLDLDQEYIAFQVLVAGSLRGYAVEDESGKHFDFPDRVYQKGQTITLHSGRGTDTATDLYWGVSGSAIWNNDGDTVKVLDPQGHVVESCNY
jgi:micrococcal nuclease